MNGIEIDFVDLGVLAVFLWLIYKRDTDRQEAIEAARREERREAVGDWRTKMNRAFELWSEASKRGWESGQRRAEAEDGAGRGEDTGKIDN